MENFELDQKHEEIMFNFENLPKELGFIPTEKLEEIKKEAAIILSKCSNYQNFSPDVVDIMMQYSVESEEIISNKKEYSEIILAQIGNEIDRILLLIKANCDKTYITSVIEDAIKHSVNEGLDEITKKLENLLLIIQGK